MQSLHKVPLQIAAWKMASSAADAAAEPAGDITFHKDVDGIKTYHFKFYGEEVHWADVDHEPAYGSENVRFHWLYHHLYCTSDGLHA